MARPAVEERRRPRRSSWWRGGLAAAAAGLAIALAPATASAQAVAIVAVGDFGRGGPAQRALGEAVRAFEAEHPADLLLTLGDNDYTDDPAAFHDNWEASFGWLGEAGVGVAGALGDHDTEGPDDGEWQFATLGMPGPYYTRRLGEVELFVLDSSSRQRVDGTQTAWLEQQLEASTARWKIAVTHRPPFTCGRYRGSFEVASSWVPLFERYGVQLVLSGDDHNYQRFASANGVTYVVHGGGNDRLYDLEPCPATYPPRLAWSAGRRGFLYLRADEERLEVVAVTIDGERIDRVSLPAGPAPVEGGDYGFEGPSFDGPGAADARHSPTGARPESKLWWHDGSWWGILFDDGTGDYHIFRLDTATQRWEDTGVPVDERIRARSDVLWDGRKLYVATHIGSALSAPGDPSRLYRFGYDGATYVLDRGFPVVLNDVSSLTLVIDKDSTGRLWATWVENGRVRVSHTTRDDRTWSEPFSPAVEGIEVGSDLSSLVAFGGDRIGLFWSNQPAGSFYFSFHRDGRPPADWSASERIDLLGSADDHLNLKADSAGRIYAAVKSTAQRLADPLVALLVREPSDGTWSAHTFGTLGDHHTRPIVLLDEERRLVHVFATEPLGERPEGAIVVKTAPLDEILFEPGTGRQVLRDVQDVEVNDPTSTKQTVSARTGLVVLASNNLTRRYWHHYDPLADDPIPEEGVPAAAADPAAPTTTTTIPTVASEPGADRSVTFDDVVEDARPVLIVAFGLSVWMVAVAAARRRADLAVLAGYVLLVVTLSGGIVLGIAVLLL